MMSNLDDLMKSASAEEDESSPNEDENGKELIIRSEKVEDSRHGS